MAVFPEAAVRTAPQQRPGRAWQLCGTKPPFAGAAQPRPTAKSVVQRGAGGVLQSQCPATGEDPCLQSET